MENPQKITWQTLEIHGYSMEAHGQIHRFSMQQHCHTLKAHRIDHENYMFFFMEYPCLFYGYGHTQNLRRNPMY